MTRYNDGGGWQPGQFQDPDRDYMIGEGRSNYQQFKSDRAGNIGDWASQNTPFSGDRFQDRSDNLQQRSDWYSDWSPGAMQENRPWETPIGEGDLDTNDPDKGPLGFDKGAFVGLGNQAMSTNLDFQGYSMHPDNWDTSGYGTTLDDKFSEWDKFGPGGERYSGIEKGALEMATGFDNQDIMDDVMSGYGQLQEGRTDLEIGLEDNLQGALSGELTPANREAFQAELQAAGINKKEQQQQMREAAGAKRGVGGGQFAKQIADSDAKYRAQSAQSFAGLQQAQSQQAQNYINSKAGERMGLKQMATNIGLQGTGLGLQGNQQALTQVSNMTQNAIQQSGLALQQSQQKMQAEMEKMRSSMSANEFENSFNLNKQKMYSDNFNNLFGSITQGLLGVGELAQNWKQGKKDSKSNKWGGLLAQFAG